MKKVRLEDVSERGSSNLAQKDIEGMTGDYPIYGASGYIGNVDFYHQEKAYIAVVKDGAGVGKTIFLPAKSSVIGTLQYIIPKENIHPKYLYYVVKNMNLARYYTGATIPHIYYKDYKKETFWLPDMHEQQKEVYVLEKIEEMIEGQQQMLANLDMLVKSRFVEMFGDINVNDKKWNTQPLGELCTIVRGSSPRPIEKFLGGDIPWIKIGDATDGESIYLHSTKEYIIQEGMSKSRMVRAGSLIFANCGVSLGFARIITFDGCIHDGWLAMEDIDSRLDKIFLLQALNQMTEHFRKIAPSGTQPNLNTAIMKAYQQIVPPMQLQKEFVAFVHEIDKSKFSAQQSLSKLETLQKSLMQQYFT